MICPQETKVFKKVNEFYIMISWRKRRLLWFLPNSINRLSNFFFAPNSLSLLCSKKIKIKVLWRMTYFNNYFKTRQPRGNQRTCLNVSTQERSFHWVICNWMNHKQSFAIVSKVLTPFLFDKIWNLAARDYLVHIQTTTLIQMPLQNQTRVKGCRCQAYVH